jgi:hypothetical protein
VHKAGQRGGATLSSGIGTVACNCGHGSAAVHEQRYLNCQAARTVHRLHQQLLQGCNVYEHADRTPWLHQAVQDCTLTKLNAYAPSSEQDSSDSATRVCGSTWSTWLNHDTSSSLLTSTWGLEGERGTQQQSSACKGAQISDELEVCHLSCSSTGVSIGRPKVCG